MGINHLEYINLDLSLLCPQLSVGLQPEKPETQDPPVHHGRGGREGHCDHSPSWGSWLW
jgi:hypothetical protein